MTQRKKIEEIQDVKEIPVYGFYITTDSTIANQLVASGQWREYEVKILESGTVKFVMKKMRE